MIDEIRADYEALAQVATRFNSRAEATTEMLTSVQAAYTPLEQGSWIGEGAEAFFAEMKEDVIPAVNRLIAALTMAGEITGEAAQTMQEADQAAATGGSRPRQGRHRLREALTPSRLEQGLSLDAFGFGPSGLAVPAAQLRLIRVDSSRQVPLRCPGPRLSAVQGGWPPGERQP